MSEIMDTGDARKHELRDANIRNIFWVGVALYAVLVLSLVVVGFLLTYFYRLYPPSPQTPTPIEAAVSGAPPLEVNPRADLAELREREDRMLNHYGWIDPQAGIVRLPIERAMDVLAQQAAAKASAQQGGGQ